MPKSNYLTKPFRLSTETISKFFNKIHIDPKTDCWIWQGNKNSAGYGYAWLKVGNFYTHRIMYAWLVHPLPDVERRGDFPVLHHSECENKSCCNPFHLSLISCIEHVMTSPGSIGFVNSKKTHCYKGHPLPKKVKGEPRRCMVCYKAHKKLYHLDAKNRMNEKRLKIASMNIF